MAEILTVKVPMERKEKPAETKLCFCDMAGEAYKRTRDYLLAFMICLPQVFKVLEEICPVGFFAIENCFGLKTEQRKQPKEVVRLIKQNFQTDFSLERLEMAVGKILCSLGFDWSFSDDIMQKGQELRRKIEEVVVKSGEVVEISPFQNELFQFLKSEAKQQGGKILFGQIVWRGYYGTLLNGFFEKEKLNSNLPWLRKWIYDQVTCLSRRNFVVSMKKRGERRVAYYFLDNTTPVAPKEKEDGKILKTLKEATMVEGEKVEVEPGVVLTEPELTLGLPDDAEQVEISATMEAVEEIAKPVLSPFAYDFLLYLFNLLKEKFAKENQDISIPDKISFKGCPKKGIIEFLKIQGLEITAEKAGFVWNVIQSRERRREEQRILESPGKRGHSEHTLFNPEIFAERGTLEFPSLIPILTPRIEESEKPMETAVGKAKVSEVGEIPALVQTQATPVSSPTSTLTPVSNILIEMEKSYKGLDDSIFELLEQVRFEISKYEPMVKAMEEKLAKLKKREETLTSLYKNGV